MKYLDPIFSSVVVSYVTELKKLSGRLEISCHSGVAFPSNHHLAKLCSKFPNDDKWDSSRGNAYLLSKFTAACMSTVRLFNIYMYQITMANSVIYIYIYIYVYHIYKYK